MNGPVIVLVYANSWDIDENNVFSDVFRFLSSLALQLLEELVISSIRGLKDVIEMIEMMDMIEMKDWRWLDGGLLS